MIFWWHESTDIDHKIQHPHVNKEWATNLPRMINAEIDHTKALRHEISEGDMLTVRIGPSIQHIVRVETYNNGVWFGLGWGGRLNTNTCIQKLGSYYSKR